MALPVIPTRWETVTVEGQEVKVRGITQHESHEVKRATRDEGEEAGEALLLALSTDTPLEDARAWLDTVTFDVVQPIIDLAVRLSGLGGAATKSSGAGVPGRGSGRVRVRPSGTAGDTGDGTTAEDQ